jgi:iron complex outermembrane receptor protein
LRGYLANIEKVRVIGMEMDSEFILGEHFSGHASSAWTEGKYASYKNGPCPLELIAASTTVCDLSGKPLTGLPRWAVSLGGEFTQNADIAGMPGQLFLRADSTTRSKTYGDPSDSKYTVISGYTLVNASLGFRQKGPWEIFFWAKNVFDRNYMQNLTVQAGNSGLIVGTPDDPRTIGVTLRGKF